MKQKPKRSKAFDATNQNKNYFYTPLSIDKIVTDEIQKRMRCTTNLNMVMMCICPHQISLKFHSHFTIRTNFTGVMQGENIVNKDLHVMLCGIGWLICEESCSIPFVFPSHSSEKRSSRSHLYEPTRPNPEKQSYR